MRTALFILLIGLLSVFLTSCKKRRLKQPTTVSFNIDINRSTSGDGTIVFESGTIFLSSFSVEGERQEGDPIAFAREFNGLAVDFSASSQVSELQFDIPQGVYTELEVSFETFDDNGDYTIVTNGWYTNTGGTDIPIRFEFSSSETFEITGEDSANSGLIVLEKDIPASALIQLDPIYWFDILTINQLENATLTAINGTPTILINESTNTNLYDLMADRIDDSTEATFD
jgi:hypothetical protein